MTTTYGDIGCDGADEDLADVMSRCMCGRASDEDDDDDRPPLLGRIVDYFVMPAAVLAVGMIAVAITVGLAWVILRCVIDIWQNL